MLRISGMGLQGGIETFKMIFVLSLLLAMAGGLVIFFSTGEGLISLALTVLFSFGCGGLGSRVDLILSNRRIIRALRDRDR